ncbi:hypothetical protein IVA98_25710 [Bradyrhizobium sp. 160]|nr:hypothetical protein [Bradyrhizobium sp. 160]MCK1626494.1 hypothetical protein [Bradyrhizobium sp. 160]
MRARTAPAHRLKQVWSVSADLQADNRRDLALFKVSRQQMDFQRRFV